MVAGLLRRGRTGLGHRPIRRHRRPCRCRAGLRRQPVDERRRETVAAAPQTVLRDQAPDIQFSLENQEQFPESANVRIFMYVYDGTEGLAGYSLWVRKDGVDVPVNVVSFGGSPGFTWPFQDARQRSQNWKAEFPGRAAGRTMGSTVDRRRRTHRGPARQL